MSAAGSNPAPSARLTRPARSTGSQVSARAPTDRAYTRRTCAAGARGGPPSSAAQGGGQVGMQDRGGVDLDDPDRLLAARRLESGGVGNAVLDRLCALAARLLSAGSAQVSLLTDVQLVVGGAGLGARAMQDGATLREEALCTVTA